MLATQEVKQHPRFSNSSGLHNKIRLQSGEWVLTEILSVASGGNHNCRIFSTIVHINNHLSVFSLHGVRFLKTTSTTSSFSGSFVMLLLLFRLSDVPLFHSTVRSVSVCEISEKTLPFSFSSGALKYFGNVQKHIHCKLLCVKILWRNK